MLNTEKLFLIINQIIIYINLDLKNSLESNFAEFHLETMNRET